MKFLFAILALICAIFVQKTLAAPVAIEPRSIQLNDPRLFGILDNLNCVIHCVQPTGQESSEASEDTRGIINNFGTLFSCMMQGCQKQ
ncbi:hypothetical protein I4U23_021205 [Adineta vaga]|nr:hypothetical protein I4U23_021205 [Adineta vaga]